MRPGGGSRPRRGPWPEERRGGGRPRRSTRHGRPAGRPPAGAAPGLRRRQPVGDRRPTIGWVNSSAGPGRSTSARSSASRSARRRRDPARPAPRRARWARGRRAPARATATSPPGRAQALVDARGDARRRGGDHCAHAVPASGACRLAVTSSSAKNGFPPVAAWTSRRALGHPLADEPPGPPARAAPGARSGRASGRGSALKILPDRGVGPADAQQQQDGRPSSRRARKPSHSSDGPSTHWRSSTASSSGPASARPTTSQ